eukprot:jgi/Tetstr1/456132/TSEL_042901.t1
MSTGAGVAAPGGSAALGDPSCTGQLREHCGPFYKHGLTQRIIMLAAFSLFLIFIQILNAAGVDVYALGVRPRTAGGLVGILCMPWVHVSWGHLFGNLIGLWTLGLLVSFHGRRVFWLTYLWCATVGGFLTWLIARPNSNHVGLSGVIFGFFAFLLFGVVWQRPVQIRTALGLVLAVLLYGGSMISGVLVPDFTVSWEGHLSGFVAGLLWALLYFRYLLHNPRFCRLAGKEPLEAGLPTTAGAAELQPQPRGSEPGTAMGFPVPPPPSSQQQQQQVPPPPQGKPKWWQLGARGGSESVTVSTTRSYNPAIAGGSGAPPAPAPTPPPPAYPSAYPSAYPGAAPAHSPQAPGNMPQHAMPLSDDGGAAGTATQGGYKNPYLA